MRGQLTGSGGFWFSSPPWGSTGLGVNAVGSRSHDQLHIHMSSVRPGVKAELDKARQAGTVAKDLKSRPNRLTTVTGVDEQPSPPKPDPRSYRVVHVDGFQTLNLCKALNDYVVSPAHETMGQQTLIVIGAGSGPSDGYYVLNSRKDLPHTAPAPQGIGYCDSILVCK
ncbi:CDP-diacylglycerol diphosphatase [Streptomyces sp. NPDC002004]